jgi:LAO/AO transport system kinase
MTSDLVDRALNGDQRALSRLATRIENDPDHSADIIEGIYPATGNAHVVGFTGAPGVGKSSLLGGVAGEISRRGKRIAVIAVDPSSPKSGGAALGDRIRMNTAALDANVFVRSLASRGRSDGLAPAVAELSMLFDAAGYDYVAIETVGSGQDQLEIADLVHTTVLVQIPGTGDSVQLLKAGAMEIADVYVVNKADLPGAQRVSRDLRSILGLAPGRSSGWDVPIVLTSASDESGFDTLLDAIDRHHLFLETNELLDARLSRIARSELRRALARQLRLDTDSDETQGSIEAIANRTITPDEAARNVLRQIVASYDDR